MNSDPFTRREFIARNFSIGCAFKPMPTDEMDEMQTSVASTASTGMSLERFLMHYYDRSRA